MNNIALGKVLRTFILDKYDWIVDYKINNYSYGFVQKYTIYYFVESSDHVDEGEEKKIKKMTEQLFKSLGPGRSETFGGVEFIYNNRKKP